MFYAMWVFSGWVNRLDARMAEKRPSLEGLVVVTFGTAIAAAIIVPIALAVNFLILPAFR